MSWVMQMMWRIRAMLDQGRSVDRVRSVSCWVSHQRYGRRREVGGVS